MTDRITHVRTVERCSGTRPLIDTLFEDLIGAEASLGYVLHSWRYASHPDSDVIVGHECIIAVFCLYEEQ